MEVQLVLIEQEFDALDGVDGLFSFSLSGHRRTGFAILWLLPIFLRRVVGPLVGRWGMGLVFSGLVARL